jgi:arylsulfatase A-like enzyme
MAGPLRIPLGLTHRGVVHLALGATREGVESGVAAWLQGLFAEPGGVSVLRPRVVSGAPGVEAAAEAPGADDEEGGTPRPNVLIYLIDTLRADHLGLYGYPRPTSPRIDAFGADATVFLDAQAQTSWTRTAVASILTGLLPQSHGVRDRDDALAPPVATLAEILAVAGYRTAGFITNGNVEPAFGTGQGFELYDYLSESKERVEFHQLSDRLNEAAFAWLERWHATPEPDRAPFFLYLHATDPHAPYTPPEPFRRRFAPKVAPERGYLDHVHAVSAGSEPAPPGTAEAWRQLYDGEIAFNDHQFGELIDRLKALDLYDSTLIVLIADHGEEFFEHGGWEHGKTLYAEQLRVPLVIRLPGGEGAGREVAELADQIDVLPTILDHLGLEPPAPVDGRSLLPFLRGDPAAVEPWAAEPSFAELRLDAKEMQSAVAGGWKLILDDSEFQRAGPVELFHVADDPAETRNLHPHHPLEEGFLAQHLRALGIHRPEPAFDADTAEIDEELKGRLEALGYLD